MNRAELDVLYRSKTDQLYQIPSTIHIFITHYNSLQYLKKCLDSVFSQKTTVSIKIILVDDFSTESGVTEYLNSLKTISNLQILRRDKRYGKGLNLFFCLKNASYKNEDIICILDGDDWFADSSSLQTVIDTYQRTGCWVTYGSYVTSDGNSNKCTTPLSNAHFQSELKGRGFREAPWIFSHLFTSKAFLWNNISEDILYFDGELSKITADQIINISIAEMAGTKRIQYIADTLVIYNIDTPISDSKINLAEQENIDRKNRRREAYSILKEAPANDFSLIIPCKGRLEYLKTTIAIFQSEIQAAPFNISITIVEHSEIPECMQIAKDIGIGWIYIPLISDNKKPLGQFNRSLSFDIGFIYGPIAKFYLLHDSDLLVPKNFWNKLKQNIDRGPYSTIQTYSHRSVWLTSKEISELIRSNPEYYTEDIINCCKLGGGVANGGSIVVDRDTYIKVGGHDPQLFFGYAPEDQMFWLKLKKIVGTIGYADAPEIPLIHLWHPPAGIHNPLLQDMNHMYKTNFLLAPENSIQQYISEKSQHFYSMI